MKKTHKKILGIMMAAVLALSLCMTSLAISTDVVTPPNSEYEINAYTKTFTEFLTNSYKEIHQSTNWYKETTVTVTYKDSEGPNEIAMNIYIKPDDEDDYRYCGVAVLGIGDSKAFNLPTGGCQFKINARSMDKSGNATMVVSLT